MPGRLHLTISSSTTVLVGKISRAGYSMVRLRPLGLGHALGDGLGFPKSMFSREHHNRGVFTIRKMSDDSGRCLTGRARPLIHDGGTGGDVLPLDREWRETLTLGNPSTG
jgi:hypothetical protein